MDGLIKSIYNDQFDILNAILKLCKIDRFFLDPTYSTGGFYKNGRVKAPFLKSDIDPKGDGVIECDVRELSKEFGVESTPSIIFDPPFLGGGGKSRSGVINKRFSAFDTVSEMWELYRDAILEIYKVLEPDGYLCFKCQDIVNDHKNYFSHVIIMNYAVKVGFYPKDLFILKAKNRVIRANMQNQEHARKFHCYFWLFQKKTTCKVDYNL